MDEEKLIKEDPNSKKAFDYLKSKGVKDHIAAGIVGNLMQESYQLNKTWAEGKVDNVGSMGIMQWHGKRLDSLYEFQKDKDPNYTNGKSISMYDQLDFILHEAETGAGDPWMKKQYDKAFAATSAEDAALRFSKNVLRPNEKYAHNDKRIAYANNFQVKTVNDAPKRSKNYREIKYASIDNVDNHIDTRRHNFFNDSILKDDLEINFSRDEPQAPVQDEQLLGDPKSIQPEAVKAPKKESYTDFLKNYMYNMNDKAMGGELNSYEGGGTHEENPLGGIPLGVGANGKMNTVEEDETSYDFEDGKYIFSNRIKL